MCQVDEAYEIVQHDIDEELVIIQDFAFNIKASDWPKLRQPLVEWMQMHNQSKYESRIVGGVFDESKEWDQEWWNDSDDETITIEYIFVGEDGAVGIDPDVDPEEQKKYRQQLMQELHNQVVKKLESNLEIIGDSSQAGAQKGDFFEDGDREEEAESESWQRFLKDDYEPKSVDEVYAWVEAGSGNYEPAMNLSGEQKDSQQCQDLTLPGEKPWHDPYGPKYNCAFYASTPFGCNLYGSAYTYNGLTANQACCQCGGGSVPSVQSAPTCQDLGIHSRFAYCEETLSAGQGIRLTDDFICPSIFRHATSLVPFRDSKGHTCDAYWRYERYLTNDP